MLKEKMIKVSQSEYERLKTIDSEFGKLIQYMKYAQSIDEARRQVKKGETIPFEEVLKEYHLK